jgi:hypothetical protein
VVRRRTPREGAAPIPRQPLFPSPLSVDRWLAALFLVAPRLAAVYLAGLGLPFVLDRAPARLSAPVRWLREG